MKFEIIERVKEEKDATEIMVGIGIASIIIGLIVIGILSLIIFATKVFIWIVFVLFCIALCGAIGFFVIEFAIRYFEKDKDKTDTQ